jgi:hypothetical protein
MAQLKQKAEYRCDEDCERTGCPGHTAILEFNSVVNVYTYSDGQGQKCMFDNSSMEAFVKMLKFYSKTRADTVDI